jgi:hypothetical protein
MKRTIRNLGLALALATAGLCGSAFAWTAGWANAAQNGGRTPLPPGWELCVLQGVSAPATQANVADLDEWQAAEGGSTDNTAAYNPFNSQRTTDVSGAPLPAVLPANGFPSFANWLAGCAATVATLLQPNMWSITAALRSGNVAPPGAFLALVDQSAWCAASADGEPCYVNAIVGVAGSIPAVLASSAALAVYGNVESDLRSYQVAVAAVTADQDVVAMTNRQLTAAQSQVSAAQDQLDVANRALRRFAIEEYVSSGLYASVSLTNPGGDKPFGPPSADGVVAQQYLAITASDLVARDQAATAAVQASVAGRDGAAKAVTQAELALASGDDAEHRSLAQMVTDVATLETAGACTTVAITAPTPTTAAPTGPVSTAATSDPAATVPATTVPSTVPTFTAPTTTVPSTDPATSVPTTTVPSTVPTFNAPTTTVPSTDPATTTTSTTVPGTASTESPQTANPAGVAALSGCVTALAPS